MKRSNCATLSADRQRRRKHLAGLVVLIALSSPAVASAAGEVLYVLHQGEGLLLALDPQTLAVEARIPLTAVGSTLTAVPDGRRLYAPDARGLAVIETSTNEIVATVDLDLDGGLRTAGGRAAERSASARPLGVTPDGAFLYVPSTLSGSRVGRIAVVSTASNSVVDQIETPFYPTTTAVTPDGANVLVLYYMAPNVVARISTASNEIVGETLLASGPTIGNIAFSPEGSLAYVCTQLGLVALDTTTFAIASEVAVVDGCSGIAVRPDGERIYIGRGTNKVVAVVDAEENEVVDEIPVARDPRRLATSLDGSRLFVTSTESDLLTVIDTATDEVLTTEGVGIEPTNLAVVLVPPPLPTATASPSPTATPPSTGSSGGGCSVVPGATPLDWVAVLVAAFLLTGMRRRGPTRLSSDD